MGDLALSGMIDIGDTGRMPVPLKDMNEKRVAFVTGGSRGIGAAIVKRLAKDGFHVVAGGRNADKLAEVCAQVKDAGGSAEALTCDIADPKALAAGIEKIAETHGRLDCLVNN